MTIIIAMLLLLVTVHHLSVHDAAAVTPRMTKTDQDGPDSAAV
jgi:hypothetical protein